MTKLGLLVLTLGMWGCAPTTPDIQHLELIQLEWGIGQDEVAAIYGGQAFDHSWVEVGWEAIDGRFKCGRVLSNGCYQHNAFRKTIRWNTQTPKVIRHEAGHAIIDLMGKDGSGWQH